MRTTLEQFYKLKYTEDYFKFFNIDYDQTLVSTKRLHILREYGKLIRTGLEMLKDQEERLLDFLKFALLRVYGDFKNGYAPRAADVWNMFNEDGKPKGCLACAMQGAIVIVDPNTKLYDSVTATRSGRDEDKAKFSMGQKVKLLEDVVNDGTYPHAPIGTLLMPKDSVGYIKDMGDFLQVIRVYEVHFLESDSELEVVGCREHELEAVEDGNEADATEGELFKKIIEQRRKEAGK